MYFLYKNEDRSLNQKKRNKVERRKMDGMNQFMMLYIYTWKCHNENLCIDILNKQKCLLS
jgi:hypothetical protein